MSIWDELDMTEDEYRAEVAEWMAPAYLTDLLSAIDNGYLDDALGKLNVALSKRRNEVGVAVVKRQRPTGRDVNPASPGGAWTDPETGATGYNDDGARTNGTKVGLEYHPPGRKLDALVVGVPDNSASRGQIVVDGNLYRLHDVQVAAQRFVITRGSSIVPRWHGVVLRMDEALRKNARCTVVGSERRGQNDPRMGKTVRLPIETIVKMVLEYNKAYGTGTEN